MDLHRLASQVAELAQRTRLNAINLAVVGAKAKLADPTFRAANERVIELVTKATEVAGRVDRLTRQLSGQAEEEERVDPGADSLARLQDCVREIEAISQAIVAEVQRLAGPGGYREKPSAAPGKRP